MCHKLLKYKNFMQTIHKREKGNIGEEIACMFLKKYGYTVVDRNYYKKWGELDIVATKKNKCGSELHFFEVKSSTINSGIKSFRPEENVNGFKVKQLRKIIQTYLVDKGYGLSHQFSFHVLCVFMNEKTRLARVKWIKNVIL